MEINGKSMEIMLPGSRTASDTCFGGPRMVLFVQKSRLKRARKPARKLSSEDRMILYLAVVLVEQPPDMESGITSATPSWPQLAGSRASTWAPYPRIYIGFSCFFTDSAWFSLLKGH